MTSETYHEVEVNGRKYVAIVNVNGFIRKIVTEVSTKSGLKTFRKLSVSGPLSKLISAAI
jgi:hypothetical protein